MAIKRGGAKPAERTQVIGSGHLAKSLKLRHRIAASLLARRVTPVVESNLQPRLPGKGFAVVDAKLGQKHIARETLDGVDTQKISAFQCSGHIWMRNMTCAAICGSRFNSRGNIGKRLDGRRWPYGASMSYSRYDPYSAIYGQDISLMDHRPEWLRVSEKAEEMAKLSAGLISGFGLGETSSAAAAARDILDQKKLAEGSTSALWRDANRSVLGMTDPSFADHYRGSEAAKAALGIDPFTDIRRFMDTERAAGAAVASIGFRSLAEEMAAKAAILPRQILDIADQVAGMRLPDVLRDYQQSRDYLALRMAAVGDMPLWAESRSHLAAFGRNLAFSEMIHQARGIGSTEIEAMHELTSRPVPTFETPGQCRSFLAGAGLVAPRGVRLRPPSAPEKIGPYQALLIKFERPEFAIRSRNRIIQRQDALCVIVEILMTRHYGPDWAADRLKPSDCDDLARKWRRKGGLAMSHADLAHCIKIMTHPEHFDLVFSDAFDDAESAKVLLNRLRDFRGMLCHYQGPGKEFTMENHQEAHILISTLDQALGSINDIDLEYYQ